MSEMQGTPSPSVAALWAAEVKRKRCEVDAVLAERPLPPLGGELRHGPGTLRFDISERGHPTLVYHPDKDASGCGGEMSVERTADWLEVCRWFIRTFSEP